MLYSLSFFRSAGPTAVVSLGLILLLTACRYHPPSYILLAAGDSLTAEGYPDYLRRLLQEQGYRVKIYNFGRSGYNTSEYLAYLRSKGEEFRALNPDFILVELGTNDVRVDGDHNSSVTYKANMREILRIFSSFKTRWGESSRILLALIPPLPEGVAYPFSPESGVRVEEEINPTLKRLAGELHLSLVDHWQLFMAKPELLPDVHPTEEGYREMARVWAEALLPYLRR
ncbi:MAG: SGNH/GDSL hydrolase family protein [Candidatus Aminicenantales bacterium]